MMTDNDLQLIRQADKTDYARWYEIDALIQQADTSQAREQLRTIRNYKYRLEEAVMGCC